MGCFEAYAIHFLRSCRGPALAELGHPDVAAGRYSGTALACATRNPFIASPQVGAQTPLRNHHRTQIPILFPGELSAVPNPSILLPASAHTLPKPRARGVFPDAPRTHYSTFPERGGDRGEAGMFRRDIRVSDAERGRVPCRSKEHTASTRPTEPNHHIQPKIKTPHHSVRGSGRAADGNRTRVSGLGSVRSTIELQPHLFQCIAPACRE